MGQPKQLLQIEGQSLIRRVSDLALDISAETVVILGKAAELIEQDIKGLSITILHNENWQKGMATSLRLGINHFFKKTNTPAKILILLCDQPLVNQAYLLRLSNLFDNSNKLAAASFYSDTLGVPAIFEASVLQRFVEREGDYGARFLLKELAKINEVEPLDFPQGAIDLDTPEEYQKFLDRQ